MPPKTFTKISWMERHPYWSFSFLAIGILGVLFFRSFDPDLAFFSNDGPVGNQVAAMNYVPSIIWDGGWQDLNSIGTNGGTTIPNISVLLLYVLQWLFGHVVGSVLFSKLYAPVALLILGNGALFFLRRLELSPLATILGALAAMLNSIFFCDACWGVASHEMALGMDFLALGLVVSNTPETRPLIRWLRLALAGLCIGVNVMDGADIGALYSIIIAAFVFFKAVFVEEGMVFKRLAHGIGGVAIVALFAVFIALQTLTSLFGTEINGIASTGQKAETKAQHWDWATQWSEPKIETLGLLVPGLFGYKMNTPNDMLPALQDAYRGGAYWGGMGRDPALDRFFDSGATTGAPSSQFLRFTAGGSGYCGILVALIAAWTITQLFRRQNSPFSSAQRKLIWFWTVVLFISLPLAWGRFAPFNLPLLYEWIYNHLPGLSTVRNPGKFLLTLSWATVILFAYGVHGLSRRYLEVLAGNSNSLSSRLTNWWAKAANFDRKWTLACVGIWGASLLGWFIYASQKTALVHYLQTRGFSDEDLARQIITFSIGQVGWWLVIFAVALALLTLILAGYFAGARAKLAGLLLGGFLVLDLGRANLPYIIHWDYKQKYEVGALNPIEEFLRNKSYEYRVAGLPFETQQPLRLYDNTFGGNGIYRIEWTQHHFLYYNIQSLDIIQMSRTPEDLKSYLEALFPHTAADAPLYARYWQLTNTRYLLGTAGFLDALNQQLDPGQHRFRIAQRFDIVAKPGITQPTQFEELTATPANDGELALFEFTGALPRAKLYSNWQINTNDQANLKTLADLNFDPARTVLISTPQTGLPALATNENSGTVEFKSYSPKQIVLATQSVTPSMLLLNDKYDPGWHVTVDGKPAELLRCNFIMRGVYLPAGAHTVEFQFSLPNKLFYVTCAAVFTGMILTGILIYLRRRKPAV